MLSNNEKNNSTNLVIVKPVDRDADKKDIQKPYFTAMRKIDGKWVKDTETYTSVFGKLTKVELENFEYKGDVNKVAKFYLEDENETYLLDLRYNVPSRGFFNSVLGLQTHENLKVSYYRNKAGYPAFYLTQNGVATNWAFTKEELPVPPKVMFKGKLHTDFSETDAFYEKQLQELAVELGGSGKIKQPTDKAVEKKEVAKTDKAPKKPTKESKAADSPIDQDVPF